MSDGMGLEQIRRYLDIDCGLTMLAKTDSTNSQAMMMVKQGQALPLACFAEEQTQGRGRRGKVWLSPPGSSIYMSLAWRFEMPVRDLGGLSLAMGVAVARVLRRAGLTQVGLKWPNDVLVEGKKIAGILIETMQNTAKTTTAIIGVGLNFKLPAGLSVVPDQPWTDVISSLTAQQGMVPAVERNEIAGLLLRECMMLCEQFTPTGQALMNEYQQYDVCRQQAVTVFLEHGVVLQGEVVGFEMNGEIRVRVDGKERLFNSAEISLRKTSHADD